MWSGKIWPSSRCRRGLYVTDSELDESLQLKLDIKWQLVTEKNTLFAYLCYTCPKFSLKIPKMTIDKLLYGKFYFDYDDILPGFHCTCISSPPQGQHMVTHITREHACGCTGLDFVFVCAACGISLGSALLLSPNE